MYDTSRTELGQTVETRQLISLATTSVFYSNHILTQLLAAGWVDSPFMENQLESALWWFPPETALTTQNLPLFQKQLVYL